MTGAGAGYGWRRAWEAELSVRRGRFRGGYGWGGETCWGGSLYSISIETFECPFDPSRSVRRPAGLGVRVLEVPMSGRIERPGRAGQLLKRADGLLMQAAGERDPCERLRTAYLAALRGAGAVLAV